jgi:hypothetical protein
MHVTQDLNSFREIIAHIQLMKKMLDASKNIFRVQKSNFENWYEVYMAHKYLY